MGMAASQARFLQLTARRTNIEYMGQQINQQRLALANASAGLFEKMLSMVPPTPPSSQDDKYYTQGYKFTDPVDGIQKGISWTNATSVLTDFPTDVVNGANKTSISITSTDSTKNIQLSAATLAAIAGGGTGSGMVGGTYNPTSGAITGGTYTTPVGIADIAAALGTALTTAQKDLGYQQIIRNVTTTHTVYNPDGALETKTTTAPALLTFDNLNRLISFTGLDQNVLDAQPTATTNQAGTVDAGGLTYGGTFDSTTYNNDVTQYEFQKATYDYQIERINQETRDIQSQDKSLELKMKQLDTEHNAIQTEMEAVQKVIQKNIEGSFKTFA